MDEWDVTVVIPTLPERKNLLANALRSVHSQTYTPFTTLVEVAEDEDDASATRNRAILKVRTPWIAFLDDDDELEPEHLKVLIDGAKDSGADVVYPWFKILRDNGEIAIVDDRLWTEVDGMHRHGFGLHLTQEQMKKAMARNCFVHLCALVRTDLAQKVRFPKVDSKEWPHPHSEDWGFWLRALDHGASFHHVAQRTWHWRQWNGQTSGQPERRDRK